MAQVTLPATFIDGVILPTDDLNKALYSLTPGEGVYSEPNGGIELQPTANGSADFRLRQEHLQPEQVVKTRFDGNWHTLDNMSDVSGQTTVDSNDVEVARRQALPGCGLRVYVPFDAAAVRWNVSLFHYVAKWFGLQEDGQDALFDEGAAIQIFLFVDGVEQREWRRPFPMTWFKRAVADYNSTAIALENNTAPWSTEAEQASFMNLSYLQVGVERGFHEVFLGFYVKPPRADSGGLSMFRRGTVLRYNRSGFDVAKDLELHQRLGVGSKSARVVAFR